MRAIIRCHTNVEVEALDALRRLQADSLEKSRIPITVVMITHDGKLADRFATYVVEMDCEWREDDQGRYQEGYIKSAGPNRPERECSPASAAPAQEPGHAIATESDDSSNEATM